MVALLSGSALGLRGARQPKQRRAVQGQETETGKEQSRAEQEPEPALDLLKTAEATHGSPEFGAQRVWQRGGAGS
eukprot:COSAG04_NODE_18284_length_446_cov_1.129683_1_plen_74_part_10